MFEGWCRGGGDGGGFDILSVNGSDTSSPPLWASFFNVSEAGGCGQVECEEIQRFVPGFSEAEEVEFGVRDECVQNGTFVVE